MFEKGVLLQNLNKIITLWNKIDGFFNSNLDIILIDIKIDR